MDKNSKLDKVASKIIKNLDKFKNKKNFIRCEKLFKIWLNSIFLKSLSS